LTVLYFISKSNQILVVMALWASHQLHQLLMIVVVWIGLE
jgi:hypothetical protein